MKRPTKKRLTPQQKAFDTDVRIETLEAIVSQHAEQIAKCAFAITDIGTADKAVAPAPLDDGEKDATEDMLIGDWLAQQANDGKTTVDLTIVEHIRTGIRLALRG